MCSTQHKLPFCDFLDERGMAQGLQTTQLAAQAHVLQSVTRPPLLDFAARVPDLFSKIDEHSNVREPKFFIFRAQIASRHLTSALVCVTEGGEYVCTAVRAERQRVCTYTFVAPSPSLLVRI